ncbi:MAG: hypothetical protein R3C13_13960 [Hyphomonas sp.]|uniref:hypothetical protein n=1 Tax=Hyphomonas sp. TaxID=87 RepID=UPI0035288399
MLKRLIVPIALAALALPAAASPELAESWGARAAALYTESVGYLDTARTGEAPTLPDHYLIDLERFSATATRLGTWNDQVSGAKDLGCIFRGMAEEAEVQLTALEAAKSADASETALKRLVTLFDDAQEISVAAAWAARHDGQMPDGSDGVPAACPANPAMAGRITSY